MKHRATIDLEFTNGDLFEQEVIKAMRAYAKDNRTRSIPERS